MAERKTAEVIIGNGVVASLGNHPDIPEAPKTGPRLLVWIDVPMYEGHKALVWVNFPPALGQEIASGDNARIRKAVMQIFLQHNGWHDHEGKPLPPPTDEKFWELVPQHMAGCLMYALNAKVQENPLAPRTN
jgi:hypothetical protein